MTTSVGNPALALNPDCTVKVFIILRRYPL
ncbi:MAG: hypothetical protein ACI85E_002003 [Marinomonas primoryensis]